MTVSIIVPVITQLVAETRALMVDLAQAEDLMSTLAGKLESARSAAQMRRLELGKQLLKCRGQLPRRGTKTDGWQAFLEAVEIDPTTAWRYMQMAENPSIAHEKGSEATLRDYGLDNRVRAGEPPLTDQDDPGEDARVSGEEAGDAAADEPEVEIDRDTWCTPKWLTDAIGDWDLDPCANERSHVQAAREFRLEQRGEDGLVLASKVNTTDRVFINPPYSDVTPWIEAYAHTRFCFLLKFDPSTKWFAELMAHTKLVLFPRGTRVQFEAPAGVPAEKTNANPFPHALFYARAEDAGDAIRAACFQPWRIK